MVWKNYIHGWYYIVYKIYNIYKKNLIKFYLNVQDIYSLLKNLKILNSQKTQEVELTEGGRFKVKNYDKKMFRDVSLYKN